MDILSQAKSGMGKTAVFVLATLQQIEPVDGQVIHFELFATYLTCYTSRKICLNNDEFEQIISSEFRACSIEVSVFSSVLFQLQLARNYNHINNPVDISR